MVGEIQKAYNALAGILKRDADEAYNTIERLRAGPISMPKDQEWTQFVEHDPHFVNPRTPLRRIEDIEYPGKHHPAAAEIRAGMLERKSKYLKSYTPGWYVLLKTPLVVPPLTHTGMSYRRPTCTSSNPRTVSTPSLRS